MEVSIYGSFKPYYNWIAFNTINHELTEDQLKNLKF